VSAIDVFDKRYYARYAPTGIGNFLATRATCW